MKDVDCVAFLQWMLPRLGYRWSGFRKVRRQVCRRIQARVDALGLSDVERYRAYLEAHDEEWTRLDPLCRVTISRFYRDRGTFDLLAERVLPELGRRAAREGRSGVDAWSAGCASGEEPYTLQIVWQAVVWQATGLDIPLRIVATDIDPHLLERARRAVYPAGALNDLPDDLEAASFETSGEDRILKPPFRRHIDWRLLDLRDATPDGRFDLVLCRNLAFTYFDDRVQGRVLDRIRAVLRPQGFLVVGAHEVRPPDRAHGFTHIGQGVFTTLHG